MLHTELAKSIGLVPLASFPIVTGFQHRDIDTDKIVYVLHRCEEPLKVGQTTNWRERFKRYRRYNIPDETIYADLFEAETWEHMDRAEHSLRQLLVRNDYILPLDNTSNRLVNLGILPPDMVWDARRCQPCFLDEEYKHVIPR